MNMYWPGDTLIVFNGARKDLPTPALKGQKSLKNISHGLKPEVIEKHCSKTWVTKTNIVHKMLYNSILRSPVNAA